MTLTLTGSIVIIGGSIDMTRDDRGLGDITDESTYLIVQLANL